MDAITTPVIPVKRKVEWGWFPFISLICAGGLLSASFGNRMGRQGIPAGAWAFWIGLIMVVMPILFRLTSVKVSRAERISLVMLAGVAFYLFKVMQSPFGFTFTDEYVHSFNVTQILQNGTLFNQNPILAATPYFPGLEIVTSALVSISGLNVFTAGLIVIGVSRLILMLSLYLFYEQVGGSAQVASIAAVIYASNPNFLYWSSQFSYESLALPLVFLVLFLIARRGQSADRSEYRSYSVAAIVGIAAVVVTHHLSSYFLAIFLGVWEIGSLLFPSRKAVHSNDKTPNLKEISLAPGIVKSEEVLSAKKEFFSPRKAPGWLAVLAFALAATWLLLVARITISYIAPVVGEATQSIINILSGLQTPRALFSSKGGNTTPLWQRIVAIGSVALMVAGIPWGLRTYWKRYRKEAIILLLVVMGLGYFGILILRLSPQAWETANRASEFLFLGLAFLLAIGVVEMKGPRRTPWVGKWIVSVGASVVFMGGVIAGWTPELILQQPSQVKVGKVLLVPQGEAVARWFLAELGAGNRVGADPTNARILLTYGDQFAYSGSTPDIQDILSTPAFANWQLEELQRYSIPFLVVDERSVIHNVMAAASFDRSSQTVVTEPTEDKYDQFPGFSQILDSGNIRIFALRTVPAK